VSDERLRGRVLEGGAFLAVRKAIGIAVSLGGILLLTRWIGAHQYGTFATISGIWIYVSDLCINGMNACLIREGESGGRRPLDLAFTSILAASVAAAALGAALSPLIGDWLRNPDLVWPFAAMLAALPLNALQIPAMAVLERELRFRQIALIEMNAQLLYYGVALGLAASGFGVWAPVAGCLAQGAATTALGLFHSKYRPAFHWDAALFARMFRYGFGHTVSSRIMGLRSLAAPLLVGRFVGPEGVAFVSLGVRLVESLGFAGAAIQRITFAVLAKIRQEPARVESAMNQALLAQVLAIAPFFAGFSAVAPWAISVFFGSDWTDVLRLYPYMTIVCFAASIFSVHVNILYALGRNAAVIRFHLLHIALFAGTAAALVPIAGLTGYAAAELASLLSYAAVHAPVSRLYRMRYANAFLFAAACVPCLFSSYLPLPWGALLFAPLLLLVTVPSPRRELLRMGMQAFKFR